MSECKHEFKWFGFNTSKCELCGLVIPDEIVNFYRDEIKDSCAREWIDELLEAKKKSGELQARLEANNEECCACSKERDELREHMQKYMNDALRMMKERDAALAKAAVLRGALEAALHGLVTSHNLLATDRPEVVCLNNIICNKHSIETMKAVNGEEIMWTTDNSKEIEVATQALDTTPVEAAERVQKLVAALETLDKDSGSPWVRNVAKDALAEWRRDKCSS